MDAMGLGYGSDDNDDLLFQNPNRAPDFDEGDTETESEDEQPAKQLVTVTLTSKSGIDIACSSKTRLHKSFLEEQR